MIIGHDGLLYSFPSRSPLFIQLAHSKKNHYSNINTITPKGERRCRIEEDDWGMNGAPRERFEPYPRDPLT
jgi:hypothetical protein